MLIADLNLTRNHGGFISYKRVAGLLQLTCVSTTTINLFTGPSDQVPDYQ